MSAISSGASDYTFLYANSLSTALNLVSIVADTFTACFKNTVTLSTSDSYRAMIDTVL